MKRIKWRTGILASIAVLGSLIYAAQLGYNWIAGRKADSARAADEKYAQILLKEKRLPVLHDTDIIGQCWRKGKKGEDQIFYDFGIDGALAITIVFGSGDSMAPAGQWQIREGRLKIIGANGFVEHDYNVIGYGNGKVYVSSPNGSVESYSNSKESGAFFSR